MTTQASILSALGAGADTSRTIAERLRTSRNIVSVALCRLAELGLVERGGPVIVGRRGRPYIRWRLRGEPPPYQQPPDARRRSAKRLAGRRSHVDA